MDLYALPPEEFTAARDAAAKQDRALKALRKPTVSAWVVNTLVRRDAARLEGLIALGGDLAAAQSRGDADALRALGVRRRSLVGEATGRALELAGRDVSPAVRLEVEATLDAAVADSASAEAVRSGRLVRALAFAGFGGVDLDGAVADLLPFSAPTAHHTATLSEGTAEAFPSGGQKERAGKGGQPARGKRVDADGKQDSQRKRVALLERAALQAQGALDDAAHRADKVARELEMAVVAVEQAKRDLNAAATALDQARQALTDATKDHSSASSRRVKVEKAAQVLRGKAERARTAVSGAQQAADAARQALDQARRS